MTPSPSEPEQIPVDDEAKAREMARVAVLRIVVKALGAILVVLAVVVFSTLILRAVKGGGSRTASGTAVPAVPGPVVSAEVRGALPPGARVVSTALGEGRLAVTVEAEDGVVTLLFDLATGLEAGRITLRRP